VFKLTQLGTSDQRDALTLLLQMKMVGQNEFALHQRPMRLNPILLAADPRKELGYRPGLPLLANTRWVRMLPRR
jgi:hypothetical protein